ncbi:PP2C family protein-serine/threonine phosphatase [Nannocystis bainbridge]|uniref:Protein phosphatase 2C domain-containing protein n=1 Tax=Nannocystis bainbridge TaxID=2995303 RepID=A0ABT5E5B5_9BACT|nr:protein phosphatase 2C domain-containing protein [Nannocystis bainbridge]MDC0721057.1 protein phosphatase 2C domain-containing protein [Nannocystis bainbridge]
MSHRRRKLALSAVGVGLPGVDDPALPLPVSGFAHSALRWPDASALIGSTWSAARTAHSGMSDPGTRRVLNEDAFLADGRLGLFIVADGVGGRPFGGLAAGEAVSVLWEWILRETKALGAPMRGPGQPSGNGSSVVQLGSVVRTALQNASRTLRTMATADPRYAGMCTTASVVLVAGDVAVVGQVGDSRVYHARGAAVRQVTEDHTLLGLQVKRGLVAPEQARGRRSPIIRALGLADELEVDIHAVPVARGDRLLLCSDGLHEHFQREGVLQHLFQLDIRTAAPAAVHHARRRGGRDNITALFVEILGPG